MHKENNSKSIIKKYKLVPEPNNNLQMTMMKRINTLLVAALLGTTTAFAQKQWIDVTDAYVMNPHYDNNDYSFWEGTPLGAANPMENAEHYSKYYNTYQDLNGLSAGLYRVSLYAFYRAGEARNDYYLFSSGDYQDSQYAQLYATSSVDDYFTPIALSSSAALTNSLGGSVEWVGGNGWWGGDYCIPNNMEAAYYWFEAGYYLNQVECQVGEDGELRIGIRKDNLINSDWTCIDTWKLEFYGTVTKITSISFTNTTKELALGETAQLEYTILPENATYKKLDWVSSDENIVSVNQKGVVTALATGSVTITATATDGSNKKATCRVTVTKNDATSESLVINEIMTANVDMFIDPAFYYGPFVELYNPTTKSASVSHFYFSDDPQNLKKTRLLADAGVIPARGYLVLWFENKSRYAPHQVDLELDTDGGTLYISDSDGNLVAQQEYPAAVSRTSYARTTNAGDTWGYTAKPTPGSSNAASQFATERLKEPVVSKDGQVFSGSLQVTVDIPAGATLRYTTDGSTPTTTNGSVSETGIFDVNYTTTYRFRLFENGKLPSPVVTRTYIEDNGYTLPIISIVGNYADLYGDDYGIFVRGNGNGIVGNGQSSKCNWNTDWEHPVNFEYMKGGTTVFNQEVSIKSAGGWSRAWSPHSFKLKADKVFEGKKYMDYQFFDDKPYLRHKVLQIRNGGNDTSARIKDAAIQTIVARSGIDADGQAYQPTVHFINGEYIGVINMREPNNKHFALANWGIDTDEIDQWEISPDSNYVQKAGDKVAFDRWYDLSADAANEDTYLQIRNLVDVDEFVNYMAVQFYLGGSDWPRNNMKAYRPRFENGRFRFVLFDTDAAFDYGSDVFNQFDDKLNWSFDGLYDTTDAIAAGRNMSGNRIVEEVQIVRIFLNMLQNDSFRKQFIDTFSLVGGSVFDYQRSQQIINELRERVSSSMNSSERNSLNNTTNNILNKIGSNKSSARMKTMADAIHNYSAFGLQSTNYQSVAFSANIDQATIQLNDIPVPTNRFDGYLFSPITLRASAPAGFKFKGWQDMNGSVTESKKLFDRGSLWYYYDQGSLDGENWTASVNSSWSRGASPLGYFTSDTNNERGYQTFLDYGGDTNNKRPTYYFTRSFTLATAPKPSERFVLNFTCDDGAIIYVNGKEVGRYNMPSGTITYSSYASHYAYDNPDQGSLEIPYSSFKRGSNVLAVELHNCDNHSTDVMWDADLDKITAGQAAEIVTTDPTYTLPTSGDITLQAIFEPMTDEEKAQTDAHPVKVNEVSASNSIYVNEHFKRNDWVELYNTTDEDIDVAGMYLSDNLEKPTKFQITAPETEDQTYSTIIPAHGYLIVWCDKLSSISQLHASFKLDAEGGDILLTAADQSWCDTLSYVIHNGDQTVGLYPDGGSELFVMSPTIGKANLINSYAQRFEETKPENPDTGIGDFQLTANGGLSLAYLSDVLVIRSDEPMNVTANIYAVSGATVLTHPLEVNGTYRLDVSQLPAGIYVARVQNADGEFCQMKFIRK